MAVAGFGIHRAAGAAQQDRAGTGIAAQESGRRRVIDAHALEQRFGRVAGAGGFRPEEAEAMAGQCIGLRFKRQGLDGFGRLVDRQVRRVRRKGSNSKRATGTTQHECGHRSGDAFRMLLDPSGQPGQ